MGNEKEVKEFFKFQVKRHFTNVSKSMFYILEDLLKQGCHFDYNYYRKRILDVSNDAKRELEDIVDNKLNITLTKSQYENKNSEKPQ